MSGASADPNGRVTDAVAKVVLPIYRSDREKPAQVGTGFFVQAGTDHFLVSAAHVLREMANATLFIYVAPRLTRQLTGRPLLTRPVEPGIDDLLDIGVLKVDGD